MDCSILLVDDSKVTRKIIKKILNELLKEKISSFTEAGNGVEALNLCRQNNFDLMFLDLTMPEMTGYEFLEALMEEGIKSNIIVLSADIQPEAESRVKKLGAREFLQKPIDKKEAINALKRMSIL